MKIHILSDPKCPTGLSNPENFFAVDAHKFINFFADRYDMFHYGLKGSDVKCTHFDLPSDKESFNQVASDLIAENKSLGEIDIVLCFMGTDNKQATEKHHDLHIIEPHIGYDINCIFAPYRVFVSQAQMHYYYGSLNKPGHLSASWYDTVIYNSINPDDFEFKTQKDNYMLYLGRVADFKGIHLAIQISEKCGKKLLVAGRPADLTQLGYQSTPSHVTMLGPVNALQRKKLLSDAFCLIAPTYYVEPFGMMVIEAHASGTPTITTDWGAFCETNINGVTGYRCRQFRDFVWAVNNIEAIDKHAMRKLCMEKYADNVVYPQYVPYFEYIHRQNYYA